MDISLDTTPSVPEEQVMKTRVSISLSKERTMNMLNKSLRRGCLQECDKIRNSKRTLHKNRHDNESNKIRHRTSLLYLRTERVK